MNGEDILAIATREIGYHEGSGKRNKYGEWYGLDGALWCMIFVQWVYHTAGADLPFKTASCGTLLRWYRENQPECIVKEPVRGCLCIFDFPKTKYDTDHVGLFVSKTDTKITTIDGNTSNGNDSNGGWVQQRTRSISYANPTYIVPRALIEEEKTVFEQRFDSLQEVERKAAWAAPTVKKLILHGALNGTGDGLDLSYDMLRLLVINDRMGVYGG